MKEGVGRQSTTVRTPGGAAFLGFTYQFRCGGHRTRRARSLLRTARFHRMRKAPVGWARTAPCGGLGPCGLPRTHLLGTRVNTAPFGV